MAIFQKEKTKGFGVNPKESRGWMETVWQQGWESAEA